jgi:hypothetical protein
LNDSLCISDGPVFSSTFSFLLITFYLNGGTLGTVKFSGLLMEETGLLVKETGLLGEKPGFLGEETGLLVEKPGFLRKKPGFL